MDESLSQVKAVIPTPLKRQVFAALALRGVCFTTWLRTQIETWLEELEQEEIEGRRTSSQQESRRYETVSERATRT